VPGATLAPFGRPLKGPSLTRAKRRARHTSMLEEPTSLRIDDPGVRALFTETARFQSWLDVEAALAQAQAELGVIPKSAAEEIVRKAQLSSLDLAAVRAGLARTGHPLVPLVWALDRACEGDAGGYVHWGATTQNVTQTGQLRQVRRAHDIFLRQLATILTNLAELAERTKDVLLPGRTHGQHAVPATFGFKVAVWIDSSAGTWSVCAGARDGCSSPCWAAAPARSPRWPSTAWPSRNGWPSGSACGR